MKTIMIALPELSPAEAERVAAGLADGEILLSQLRSAEVPPGRALFACLGALAHLTMRTLSDGPSLEDVLQQRVPVMYKAACKVLAATGAVSEQEKSKQAAEGAPEGEKTDESDSNGRN